MRENKGHSNIIPMNERTPEERTEIARKGGYAKAASQARKRSIRETFEAILEKQYHESSLAVFDQEGIYYDENDGLLARVCGEVIVKAIHGNLQATKLLFEYLEEPLKKDD